MIQLVAPAGSVNILVRGLGADCVQHHTML